MAKYGHQIIFAFGNPDDFCLAGRQQGYGAREILHFSDNLTKKNEYRRKSFAAKEMYNLKRGQEQKHQQLTERKNFKTFNFNYLHSPGRKKV